jgi:hypothetical protein
MPRSRRRRSANASYRLEIAPDQTIALANIRQVLP